MCQHLLNPRTMHKQRGEGVKNLLPQRKPAIKIEKTQKARRHDIITHRLFSASPSGTKDAASKVKLDVALFAKSTITCECGEKILLVPDLKSMQQAIDLHLKNHKKKQNDSEAENSEMEQLRQELIAKVFVKASTQ